MTSLLKLSRYTHPSACMAPSSLSFDHPPSELRRLGPSSITSPLHTPALMQRRAASHPTAQIATPVATTPHPDARDRPSRQAAAIPSSRPRLSPPQSTAPPWAVNRIRATARRMYPARCAQQSAPAASAHAAERAAARPRPHRWQHEYLAHVTLPQAAEKLEQWPPCAATPPCRQSSAPPASRSAWRCPHPPPPPSAPSAHFAQHAGLSTRATLPAPSKQLQRAAPG